MEKSRRTIALFWPLFTLGCGGFAPRDYGGAPKRSNAGMAGFSYDAGTGEAGRATSSPPRKDPTSDWGVAASGSDAQAALDANDSPGGTAASVPSDEEDGSAGQGGDGPESHGGAGAASQPNGGHTGGMSQGGHAAAGTHGGGTGGSGGAGGAGGRAGTGGASARGGSAGRAGSGGDGAHDGGGDGGRSSVERALLISEYVESGRQKAIELRALATSSLEGCEVVTYSNGATVGSPRAELAGELDAGHAYVICSKELVEELGTACDQKFGFSFNGNDAVTLECDGTLLDAIGEVGFDPKTAWSGSDVSTADQTLRRRCAVTQGDTNATDPFDPSLEWQSYPSGDVSGLGSPDCD